MTTDDPIMTQEQFDLEIDQAFDRALDHMVQAKFATFRTSEYIAPLLEALRGDYGTLHVKAPDPYSINNEFMALGTLLRLARAWLPDHAVIAFDTLRVLDPAAAPLEEYQTEDTLFEATARRTDATPVLLVHGYNARDGASAFVVDYIFKPDGEIGINQQRFVIDHAWLSWSAVATNMERFLLQGLLELEASSFDEIATEAHANGYTIYASQQEEGLIHARAWGDFYTEMALKPGLSPERIEAAIIGFFELARAASTTNED